ncbi:DUF6804 family protein [Cryobacterium glaciale]|uniref:DUF6804 family protein n=1 Tax=Cryobacterium glaciale TaxID=1259145 RepID=UPI003B971169
MSVRPSVLLGATGAILSLIALTDMPGGFYIFLRVALTVLSLSLGFIAIRNNFTVWLWGLAPIAALWNPIFPVFLDRTTWAPYNFLAAIFFASCAVFLKKRRGEIQKSRT